MSIPGLDYSLSCKAIKKSTVGTYELNHSLHGSQNLPCQSPTEKLQCSTCNYNNDHDCMYYG